MLCTNDVMHKNYHDCEKVTHFQEKLIPTRIQFLDTVFTVTIRDSGNSRCSFLARNNWRYATSIFIFPSNSQFKFYRLHYVALTDEVVLESPDRGFHVVHCPYLNAVWTRCITAGKVTPK